MLTQLENQKNIISMEALTPSQTLSALTDRLPGFVSDVKQFLKDLFSTDQEPAYNFFDTKKIPTEIRKVNYTSLMPLRVYVPAGLKVTYLEYIAAMEQAQAVVDVLVKETLQPFNRWLAIQLGNPSNLAQLRSDRDISGFKLHDIEAVKKAIAVCFDPGSVETETTFGKVFKRAGDWHAAAEQLNDLNNRLIRIDRSVVSDLTDSIAVNLDVLLRRIDENPEEYKLSGNTLNVIAQMSYNMARECEFYSVYYYQLRALFQAFEDSEKKVGEALNRE